MVSKPANPETCCTKCDQYRIAGVVVCINFRANTWHVGAVSLYNMFPDGRLSRILRLHWTALHSLGDYSLKTIHLFLWLWELLCWIPATDGRSPSFEYCANKQQATEATSEKLLDFSVIENKLPNKQTNKQSSSIPSDSSDVTGCMLGRARGWVFIVLFSCGKLIHNFLSRTRFNKIHHQQRHWIGKPIYDTILINTGILYIV